MLKKLLYKETKDSKHFFTLMRRLGFKNIECVIGGTNGAFRKKEQIFEVSSKRINR